MAADNSSSHHAPEGVTFSDFSGSLVRYFKDLGELDMLSCDEMDTLLLNIDAAYDDIKSHLRRFAFVAAEFQRICSEMYCDCTKSVCMDYFSPSTVKRLFEGDAAAVLSASSQKVEELLDGLKNSFVSGDFSSADLIRLQVASALDGIDFNNATSEEFADIAFNYVDMYKSGHADAGFVSEKFCMSIDELLSEVSVVKKSFDVLREAEGRAVEANLRLVVSVASKFRNRGVPFNDLIQEGNIGLLKALRRYDYKLGNKFSTYAIWWIKNSIMRALSEQSRVVRLPVHMIQQINAISRTEQHFLQLWGRMPEVEELASELGMSAARVSSIRKMAYQSISLQAAIGNDEDSGVFSDIISDASAEVPGDAMSKAALYEMLHEILRTLPERDQQILIWRYGLFGQPVLAFEEISHRFNLSRERIRQLEARIMKNLRTPDRLKQLDDR
ncbi:MAG: sigma-70 family RNA polymerase sigma factor [Lentisphaerae bacterium]|nr:sigma-70 family RNA polymerase sigma factor [Lentisphaerota bacterium]